MPRLLGLLSLVLLLSACAAAIKDPSTNQPDPMILEEIAAAVAGSYTSIRPVGDRTQPVSLQVVPDRWMDGVALELRQSQAGHERRFQLLLRPGPTPDRFDGRFVPMHRSEDGAGPACPMRFQLAAGRLVGETDPSACRFQAEGLSIGLLKEIVFEADRVILADQLFLEDGTAMGDVDQLTLGRVAHFSGQVLQRDGNAWRMAGNLSVSSGGNLIEPLDAAGMSLGLMLNLELVYSAEHQIPSLRLQVLDQATQTVSAEVWAAIHAELIGLGLETLRIELYRQSRALPTP